MSTPPEGYVSMVRLSNGAIALVREDGARVLASMDARGVLWLDVRADGEKTRRTIHAPRAALGRGSVRAADPGVVRSPTSGVLRSITVAVGDVVTEGAVLGHVEAMKMQLELRAETSGTVASIDAAPGDRVERGALLLRITR